MIVHFEAFHHEIEQVLLHGGQVAGEIVLPEPVQDLVLVVVLLPVDGVEKEDMVARLLARLLGGVELDVPLLAFLQRFDKLEKVVALLHFLMSVCFEKIAGQTNLKSRRDSMFIERRSMISP